MSTRPLLVLGTRNAKKAAELVELFSRCGLDVALLSAFPAAIEVEETGDTFAANAALKAGQQARQLGQWVLGEDSGLVVDALHGAPGVYSARYAGPAATDEANNRRLLLELDAVAEAARTAHYVCHMTLCDAQGTVRAEAEDICRGRIRREPAGTHGFGYDPLFEIVEYHRTFGQIGPAVKQAISHRSRAARLLLPQLVRLVESGAWD
ncbi:MAG: RdgB/HAM1 family non-canonical purine NTP pyrophosphatase [Planctomycetia bacterium]|nr:RdgB/HAM1 family non-canonical purine NTP pyrophosphatase [Planctomycetia bacterium]